MKIVAKPDNLFPKCSIWSNLENGYTHFVFFCELVRKSYLFENLKWAQGSQWRKQRISNFINSEKVLFFYISLVRYNFYIFTSEI